MVLMYADAGSRLYNIFNIAPDNYCWYSEKKSRSTRANLKLESERLA